MTLKEKLLAMQAEIGLVEATGKNQAQGYEYLSEKDIIAAVSKLMVKYKVASWITVEQAMNGDITVPDRQGGSKIVRNAYVVVKLKLMDTESPEELECEAAGYGEDYGDKAIYKAQTGATKYAYKEAFRIAAGDDPENDSAEYPAPQAVKAPVKIDFQKKLEEVKAAAKKNGWQRKDWEAFGPINESNIAKAAEVFGKDAKVIKAIAAGGGK